jgi:hypothetical protein
VTEGCEPDRFCPDEPLSRAQMASFLVRALDLPATNGEPFVDTDGVHADAIAALAAAEVTLGCAEERFCPDEPISREQMATFLARGFELPGSTTVYFTVGGVHQENINAVADAGITAGCDRLGTRFCPDDEVTRAQMASFLARAMGLAERVSIPLLLESGDEGPDVAALQDRLRALGYTLTDTDGSYDAGTADAVRAFQLVHELLVDGIYGPETRAALVSPQRPTSVVGSFTTPLVPGEDRNDNIHRAADLIDGDVIEPGASYSLDDAIGDRTREHHLFRALSDVPRGDARPQPAGCPGGQRHAVPVDRGHRLLLGVRHRQPHRGPLRHRGQLHRSALRHRGARWRVQRRLRPHGQPSRRQRPLGAVHLALRRGLSRLDSPP